MDVSSPHVSLTDRDVAGLLLAAIVVGFAYHAGGWRPAAHIVATGAFWLGLLYLHNPYPDVDDDWTRRQRFVWGFVPLFAALVGAEELAQFGVAPQSHLGHGVVVGLLWWLILLVIERAARAF